MSNTNLPRVPVLKPRSPLFATGRALLIAAALIAGAVLGFRATSRPASSVELPDEIAAKRAARR
jgi:hypothetical protein